MSEKNVITVPYSRTVNPLGKVVVEYLPNKTKKVKAYLLAEHIRKGVQTGIAIEGSKLMKEAYGITGAAQGKPNLLSIIAQKTGSYLARKVDDDGNTTLIYWATGARGDAIQTIGDLSAYDIEQFKFTGPTAFGETVRLMPAIRYFVDRFAKANWGMYVFFTQGKIDDMEEVQKYSVELAQQITSGQRNPLKLVLLGIGSKIDVSSLKALDNLDTGNSVDLWDYRIAAEMKDVLEIFAELGDANTMVAPDGRVFDPAGHIVVDYCGKGVPSLMQFSLPPDAKSFQLELSGQKVVQPIS